MGIGIDDTIQITSKVTIRELVSDIRNQTRGREELFELITAIEKDVSALDFTDRLAKHFAAIVAREEATNPDGSISMDHEKESDAP